MNPGDRIDDVRGFIIWEADRLIWPQEWDIREDVIQEGYLAVLETPYEGTTEDMRAARRKMEDFLRRWRERDYKTQMWQIGLPDVEEGTVI